MFLLVSMFHFSNKPFAYSLPIHFSIKKRLFKKYLFWEILYVLLLFIYKTPLYTIYCIKIYFFHMVLIEGCCSLRVSSTTLFPVKIGNTERTNYPLVEYPPLRQKLIIRISIIRQYSLCSVFCYKTHDQNRNKQLKAIGY